MPTIVSTRLEALAEQDPVLYEILRDFQQQLNQVLPFFLSGTDHPSFAGPGAASSSTPGPGVSAAPGTVYLQRSSLSGPLVIHVKDSGFGPTGWAELGAFGSIPPTAARGFQAVATPTTVTFYYDGTNGSSVITLYRANGEKVQIAAGSTAVTGLSANTTYFFYPYYDERSGSLQFVTGTIGSPAIAATVDDPKLAQQARLAHHIPLSPGTSISVTTPNVGSSASSVGGGFGGNGRLA